MDINKENSSGNRNSMQNLSSNINYGQGKNNNLKKTFYEVDLVCSDSSQSNSNNYFYSDSENDNIELNDENDSESDYENSMSSNERVLSKRSFYQLLVDYWTLDGLLNGFNTSGLFFDP